MHTQHYNKLKNEAVSVTELSISETRSIAKDGFIYGLPLIMNYSIMYQYCIDKNSKQYKAPFNIISNGARLFTYKDTAIVTPNSDTPYSGVWMDLRAEPIVLSVPHVEEHRYYSIMLNDVNTFNYGYIGSRATGNESGSYMVVGPNWKGSIPPGIKKVFHSPSQFSYAIYRTQLFGPKDMEKVKEIQSDYKVQTLSAYLGRPTPPAPPAIHFPPVTKALLKENYFHYLDFVLQFAPAGPEEKQIREKLAKIGVGRGTFAIQAFDAEHKRALLDGMRAGEAEVDAKVATLGEEKNGWRIGSAFGDRAYYHGDWLRRAAAAKAGIYGNDADEAMYPMAHNDVGGQPLDGSRHNYSITFPSQQFPPVKAFWSLTIYDGKTQLLIKNPINRYLINSKMLPAMKKNADDSLTIYVQHKSPGPEKESNWLPAPDGPIYLVMRLYWPTKTSPSLLNGTWTPPAIKKNDLPNGMKEKS